ncbi:MAG: hypothetical protein ACLSAF_22840 [Intestinimonas sp.]
MEAAQRVTDNGLRIQARYIDAGRKNRPGGVNPCGYITIHETGNAAAAPTRRPMALPEQRRRRGLALVGWHLHGGRPPSLRSIRLTARSAYHAGTACGTGNAWSIGSRSASTRTGDVAKARENAARCVRLLMEEHGTLSVMWSSTITGTARDCPYTIRHTSGAWEAFLALCEEGRGAKDEPADGTGRASGWPRRLMDYLEAYSILARTSL